MAPVVENARHQRLLHRSIPMVRDVAQNLDHALVRIAFRRLHVDVLQSQALQVFPGFRRKHRLRRRCGLGSERHIAEDPQNQQRAGPEHERDR